MLKLDPRLLRRKKLRISGMGGSNRVYSSPTQAGEHVYISGLGGKTFVLNPGRKFQQVATNQLEKFRCNPVFEGDRMYIRGNDKFYCISATADRVAQSPTPSLGASGAR